MMTSSDLLGSVNGEIGDYTTDTIGLDFYGFKNWQVANLVYRT